MKKKFMFSLFAFLAVAFVGWFAFDIKQDDSKLPIEMVAFNSLTREEQSLMVTPKDSHVEKVRVNDEIHSSIEDNYTKSKVYKITFNQTATQSHGNLLVFVDTDKQTVIGKGFDDNTVAVSQ